MHKIFCRVIAAVAIMCCLCLSAGAVETEWTDVSYDSHKVNPTTILRASGSFDKSLKPYSRSQGDTDFPLEAGETVRIYATYSPSDASFEIPERGNYRLGIKNNSGRTVSVSGFVKY